MPESIKQNTKYQSLQKQLDGQRKRLMRERDNILSKQFQKLQLYEKIDLVQFFNYKPAVDQSNQSKQQAMYHLTYKFKQYMKNFTENNVYKKMGHHVNSSEKKEKSLSKTHQQSNVQKNSQLGRNFQRMKHYQNDYNSYSHEPSKYYEAQNQPFTIKFRSQIKRDAQLNQDNNLDKFQNNIQRKLFQNNDASSTNINEPQRVKEYKTGHNKDVNIINENINIFDSSLQQLSHTVYQQQKIFILSQLNHYIKLFKQSQLKRQFMQKHLQNLYDFFIDVKLSKKRNSYDYSESIENKMLKKQVDVFREQLRRINLMHNQQYLNNNQQYLNNDPQVQQCQIQSRNGNRENNFLRQSRKSKVSNQIRKIDRFKQFAEHISLIQKQLIRLINQSNSIKSSKQKDLQLSNLRIIEMKQTQVLQLNQKIRQLQALMNREEAKKGEFLLQVRRFKQIMDQKENTIQELRNQLQQYKNLVNYSKNEQPYNLQNHAYNTYNLHNQNNQHSDYTDYSFNQDKNQANLPYQLNQSNRKSYYSRVTTKQPQLNSSNQQSRVSQIIDSRVYDKIFDKIDKIYDEQNRPSRISTQNEFNTQKINQSISRKSSRSKSRSDSKSSSYTSKLGDSRSYEPRPYQRYHTQYDLKQMSSSRASSRPESLLYNRIDSSRKSIQKTNYCRF